VFNGRNGIELIDNLRLGCAGTIPGVECCDIQVRIYNEWQAGNHERAIALFKEVHPLLSYLMLSVDTLLCYGKRLAARRIGILDYLERGSGLTATKEGMETLAFWSKNLESFGRQ
jgi:2-keto-3-deoxy-L-arabinonate dehydratase